MEIEETPFESPSTDHVLSESVERVRSSRRLLDHIDQRLQRSHRLLQGTDHDAEGATG